MESCQSVGSSLSNAEFGVNLYTELSRANPDSSIFFSPISITLALAMTLLGSSDRTESELKEVMKLNGISDQKIHSTFNKMLLDLQKLNQYTELKIVNKFYGEKSYEFLFDYLAQSRNYYMTALEAVDFRNKAEEYVPVINKWVEDNTNNLIKNLLHKDSLTAETTLVLINAIYFKGIWQTKFRNTNTITDNFIISCDESVNVQFMRMFKTDLNYQYHEVLESQILQLQYQGATTSLVIILPDNELSNVENKLTGKILYNLKKTWKNEKVNVWLPKFEMSSEHDIQKSLQNMGLKNLFSKEANLSKMSAKNDLFVSNLVHKAYIKVDEEGTEAAAATAVIVPQLRRMYIGEVKTFKADHPFIFLVQDNNSGAILFMGKVIKP